MESQERKCVLCGTIDSVNLMIEEDDEKWICRKCGTVMYYGGKLDPRNV